MAGIATLLGIVPESVYHLLALLVPLLAWYITRHLAKRRHITVVHNSSLAVSYWEELLFRGLAYGVIFALTGKPSLAIAGSAVLFGLLHVRNLWWATPRRVVWQAIYAGLFIGVITGVLRRLTGDIYMAIAVHALNNFIFIGLGRGVELPSDGYLRSKEHVMQWWQHGFFELSLIVKDKLL